MINHILPVKFSNKIIRNNFYINVVDGALFSWAMSFASLTTVLPVLVKKLGGSNVAIGLIPVVWTFGFNFPQILIANRSSRLSFKKPFILKTALFQRIPWLLLAVFSYLLISHVDSNLAVFLFFFCFSLAAIAGSINLPAWFDLVAKLTPVTLRGRLFALRSLLGSLLGILGGWSVAIILDSVDYPDNFGYLFLICFSIMMVSYISLLFLKEEETNPSSQKLDYREFFLNLKLILKEKVNYRNFIIADALMMMALTADAFYTVHAMEIFSLSDGYAGQFIVIMMVGMVIGNLLFGFIADKFGHRLNLVTASWTLVSICFLALFAPIIELYYLVFVGISFVVTLLHISRLTIISEICSEEDRPTYVALTNTVTSPFILSGLAVGWLADKFGYSIVFVIAGSCALLSAVWWVFKVQEPRRIKL